MIPYHGDDRLRHHVVFERKAGMSCVFCNALADTREHTPSKVFLSQPYPENLSVVPSCHDCNNSFSSDELYTYILIKILCNHYFPESYAIDDRILTKINMTKEGKEAALSGKAFIAKRSLNSDITHSDARVERVLKKLAICHATHDLSEGYYQGEHGFKLSLCYCNILPHMTQDELDELDAAEPVLLLPEIGSMGYEHIFVVETTLRSNETVCLVLWNDVQEGGYRYICSHRGHEFIVKIVISEFLYAMIIFSEVKE
jgi:hypothetical protein